MYLNDYLIVLCKNNMIKISLFNFSCSFTILSNKRWLIMETSKTLPANLNDYVNKWKHKKGSLIMILHAVQDNYGFIPQEICFTLAKELKIPLARIYEVLTFYNYFKLKPTAKYKISVCLGTACYLNGAEENLQIIKETLNIEEGETTEDGLFTIETIRCYGCCSLAPVISINGEIYGKVHKARILNILAEYKSRETGN